MITDAAVAIEPALAIVCKPCGRRGRYSVERLMAEHGDAKLTELCLTLLGIRTVAVNGP
jgi:hypothetical protein